MGIGSTVTLPSARLIPGLLSAVLIVAFGVSARAASPADRARAVVQVVALGSAGVVRAGAPRAQACG